MVCGGHRLLARSTGAEAGLPSAPVTAGPEHFGLIAPAVEHWLEALMRTLSWRTDESQGGWVEHFGGVIGGVAGRGGLRSPPVSLVWPAGTVSARFLPEFA